MERPHCSGASFSAALARITTTKPPLAGQVARVKQIAHATREGVNFRMADMSEVTGRVKTPLNPSQVLHASAGRNRQSAAGTHYTTGAAR